MAKCEFALKDQSNEMAPRKKGTVEFVENGGGILIRIEGYGDKTSPKGEGCPILIENWMGEARVVIWGDINKENHTHLISLEGAKETLLKN